MRFNVGANGTGLACSTEQGDGVSTIADQGQKRDGLNHFDLSQDKIDKYELRLPPTVYSLISSNSKTTFKGYLMVSFEHGAPTRIGLDCK